MMAAKNALNSGIRNMKADNIASQRVLQKSGFMLIGEIGEEGLLFVRRVTIRPEEH